VECSSLVVVVKEQPKSNKHIALQQSVHVLNEHLLPPGNISQLLHSAAFRQKQNMSAARNGA
jgi:hypothetical protein